MNDIHSKGQYFTTDITLQYTILDFIKNNPKTILEPSIGRGDLVKYITENYNVNFDMYELDESIELLENIDREKVNYGDFIKANISKKYKTIIGNPPYVKKSTGNLYLEFIEKCFNLLKIKGELIFIVPSDFLKLTSASKLLIKMMKSGTFTHIYHPNNENLFANVAGAVELFLFLLLLSLFANEEYSS